MYKHWNIGTVYHDHKRNGLAVLVAISPYKSKSGVYLDFRYINSDKYIRQAASKALSRFEATDQTFQIDTASPDNTPSVSFGDRLFESLVETGTGLFSPKLKMPVPKQDVLKRYDNVIYVDFIKKCIIYKGVI